MVKFIKKKNNSGFTLLELIIVVVILGILASVALPQYSIILEKSREDEAKVLLGELRKLQIAYYTEHQEYGDISDLDPNLPMHDCTPDYYFKFSADGSGTVRAKRCSEGQGGKPPGYRNNYQLRLSIDGTFWYWGEP